MRIAETYFTNLEDARHRGADIQVVLGDARLSLEREERRKFDVLAVDAFSSDSIPTHLLTIESLSLYLHHLELHGILALHISNKDLDLRPVVYSLARYFDLPCILIDSYTEDSIGASSSQWMLLTRNQAFLSSIEIDKYVDAERRRDKSADNSFPLWTDDYTNLLGVLR